MTDLENEDFDMNRNDPLDEGFELLQACSREQAPFDLELEERMTKEFSNANRTWMPRLGKVAVIVLLCITVAGAAVAGTGGFDWIWDSLTLTADEYDAESGQILDGDGNVIGTLELVGEDATVDHETLTD